ncbi:uncharacterized protein At3g50808-like [Lotus japonicus]|uniref:uncharacterized protein At3g50808-like n=1 Tax=Lotus japonicus TaxID=34305 RepID=UPI00258A406B|nr:uncharacterized protein At3g50808-like [Lotus japonicus]
MEKHIDCSEIQPYKCNKRLVISLCPLPHTGRSSNDEASCNTCSRRLTEPYLYRYCSISCKAIAVSKKPDDSIPPFMSIKEEEASEPPNLLEVKKEETSEPSHLPEEKKEEFPEPSMRKRKRKGIPHRAPFF